MFREMVRKKQAISPEECAEILKNEPRGVLSVLGDDGYPYGLPMNYLYCEETGVLYFHGGKRGHKIDAMKRCDKVSFCVYDEGFRRDGEWSLNIRSVIVFGRIKWIDDPEEVQEISRRLSRKYTKDEAFIQKEIDQWSRETLCFMLVPEQITGKIVNES